MDRVNDIVLEYQRAEPTPQLNSYETKTRYSWVGNDPTVTFQIQSLYSNSKVNKAAPSNARQIVLEKFVLNKFFAPNPTLADLSNVIQISIVNGSGLLTGNIDAYGGGGYNTRQTEIIANISPSLTFMVGQAFPFMLTYTFNPVLENYVTFAPTGTQFTVNFLSYANNASAFDMTNSLYDIQFRVHDIV